MNSSGLLFNDAGIVCASIFVLMGGWLATAVGLVLSVLVVRRQGRRTLGVGLFLGSLAPVAYLGLWFVLAGFHGAESPEASHAAILAVVVVLLVAIFAAPLAALVALIRGPRIA